MQLKGRVGLVLALLVLLCTGCANNSKYEYKGTAACDTFINSAWHDNINGRGGPLVNRVDSFYATLHKPSADVLMRKHCLKIHEFTNHRQFNEARKTLDSIFILVRDNNWERDFTIQYRDALVEKGNYMYETGNYDTAYDCFFKIQSFNIARKDTCSIADDYFNLGMALYNQKRYHQAASYFIQSFIVRHRCTSNTNFNFQQTISNIGICYEKAGYNDSALFYYDSALLYISHNPQLVPGKVIMDKSLAVIWGNKGGVFLKLKMTDTALHYLNKSYDINIRPHHDNGDALLTHVKLFRAWLDKGNQDSAISHAWRIKAEFDTISHQLQPLADWQQLMCRYHAGNGRMDSAYLYQKQFINTSDTLLEAERKLLKQGVINGIREKESEYRIEMLSQESKTNRNALWFTIIILLLVLVIVYMVYINYLKSKKNIEKLVALNKLVTEQKLELEQKHREKDRILQVVAHDLRSPVGGISYMLEMLRMKNQDNDEETKEIISLLQATSGDALSLINELLNYSTEVAAGVQKSSQDIVAIVRRSAELMQMKATEKQQRIKVSLPHGPVVTSVDKERIARVFQNIMGNAIKFSKEGADITVKLQSEAEGVTIQITDEGIGIPEKLQADIFDMLTTAQRQGTAGEKSYGLGLSIARQIVSAHSGRIWLSSLPGNGTTFYIWLPY